MELDRKGREAIRSGLTFLGRDTEEEGDYVGWEIDLSMGSEKFEPHIGHPHLGVWHWSPLANLKSGAVRKPRPCLRTVRTFAYS